MHAGEEAWSFEHHLDPTGSNNCCFILVPLNGASCGVWVVTFFLVHIWHMGVEVVSRHCVWIVVTLGYVVQYMFDVFYCKYHLLNVDLQASFILLFVMEET